MKLATWNVALPVAEARRKEMNVFTDQVQADVWVLTETHDRFTPGLAFSCSSEDGRDGSHNPGHRWVTIWSNSRLEPLVTSDKQRTTAARVFPQVGNPFVVYGTVLPWIGSEWQGHAATSGVAFGESLKVQAADWKQLCDDFPDDEFFLLGDLNQDLVSSKPHYYGSQANRTALEGALRDAGLTPLTAGDDDPIRRDSPPCACIDHICIRVKSRWQAESTARWPDKPKPDKPLSDHFGVSVSLVRR